MIGVLYVCLQAFVEPDVDHVLEFLPQLFDLILLNTTSFSGVLAALLRGIWGDVESSIPNSCAFYVVRMGPEFTKDLIDCNFVLHVAAA